MFDTDAWIDQELRDRLFAVIEKSHWSNWDEADQVFDGNEYYSSLDSYGHHLKESLQGVYDADDIPEFIYGTKVVPFEFCEFDGVVLGLSQGLETAESLWEEAIETGWHNVNAEWPEVKSAQGLPQLQKAIDLFMKINRPIWRVLERFDWFYASSHSIGVWLLEMAFRKAELANAEFSTIEEDRSVRIHLDQEFWSHYFSVAELGGDR
jgi:hypothetical protein